MPATATVRHNCASTSKILIFLSVNELSTTAKETMNEVNVMRNKLCFVSSLNVTVDRVHSVSTQRAVRYGCVTPIVRRANHVRGWNVRHGRYVCALPAIQTFSTSVMTVVDPKVLNTSISAISKLLVTLALGAGAASRGLLDPATLTALSKVVYNLFLPSLLFTNIVRTLSRPRAPGLFLVPIAAVAQVAVGLLVGWIGALILRLRPGTERRVYLVCTAFGNSAALPLLFATALFSSTAAFPQLVSGLSFFLLGWTGLFWSFGYWLLTKKDKVKDEVSGDDGNKSGFDMGLFVKRVATPPLVASIVGLIIGLIPSIRTLLMNSPLFAALVTLSAGYGPAAVLILAGSLYKSAQNSKRSKSSSSSSNLSNVTTNQQGALRIGRMVTGISITRFLLIPAFAMLLVKYGPYKSQFIALAVLLESVMPSAQNSTLILNMENQNDAAAKVASILLSVYLIGVIPMSIALTFFLSYTGI